MSSLDSWAAALDARTNLAPAACTHNSTWAICIPRGARIVFLGDSTMRYQYLHLVHALRHGTENTYAGKRSIVSEKTWRTMRQRNWFAFFNGTTSPLAPHEWCSCYRGRSDKQGYQQRYFHANNVSIIYVELMGKHEMHGIWWPGDPINATTSPAPPERRTPYTWI